MRCLLALIRKEWRDARALTAGAAVAVVALSVAANEAWLDYRSATFTAAYLIPGLVAIYLVTIASDLVASDVATRRVETFALLPARPFLLWSAKLSFLLISGLVFLIWVVGVQLALHAHASGTTGALTLVRNGGLALPHLSLALGLACTVFFFSTLLERGISAVLAGVLTCAAGAYALVSFSGTDIDLVARSGLPGIAGLVVAFAFATGSAFAFTSGAIHLVGRVRRGVLGLACVSLLLVLPAAICIRILDEQSRAESDDRTHSSRHEAGASD